MCGAAARSYRPTRPTREPMRASWPPQSRARGRSKPPGRGGLTCTLTDMHMKAKKGRWSGEISRSIFMLASAQTWIVAPSAVQETTSLFALLWRARVTRHAHAASHVPSEDTAGGEHDTPTPVLVRPRGRAPTSESGVREHTSHSWCSSRTTRTRTKIKHTQMTTKAAFFGRIRLN